MIGLITVLAILFVFLLFKTQFAASTPINFASVSATKIHSASINNPSFNQKSTSSNSNSNQNNKQQRSHKNRQANSNSTSQANNSTDSLSPSVLIGKWFHKDKVPAGGVDGVIVTTKTFSFDSSGMPGHLFKHPNWKKIGNNKWKISGLDSTEISTRKHGAEAANVPDTVIVGFKGNHLLLFDQKGIKFETYNKYK